MTVWSRNGGEDGLIIDPLDTFCLKDGSTCAPGMADWGRAEEIYGESVYR